MTTTILTDEQIENEFIEHGWSFGGKADMYIEVSRAIEQAVLQSPEVQAWKKDAERYQFCRSQTSPAEIHINGIELGLAGESLDEAMDEEMKEWKP